MTNNWRDAPIHEHARPFIRHFRVVFDATVLKQNISDIYVFLIKLICQQLLYSVLVLSVIKKKSKLYLPFGFDWMSVKNNINPFWLHGHRFTTIKPIFTSEMFQKLHFCSILVPFSSWILIWPDGICALAEKLGVRLWFCEGNQILWLDVV